MYLLLRKESLCKGLTILLFIRMVCAFIYPKNACSYHEYSYRHFHPLAGNSCAICGCIFWPVSVASDPVLDSAESSYFIWQEFKVTQFLSNSRRSQAIIFGYTTRWSSNAMQDAHLSSPSSSSRTCQQESVYSSLMVLIVEVEEYPASQICEWPNNRTT